MSEHFFKGLKRRMQEDPVLWVRVVKFAANKKISVDDAIRLYAVKVNQPKG